jgi:hypothetical protein
MMAVRKKTDPYQPRSGTNFYKEVCDRIIFPENPPYLIYGIGIARSGTTVSLNILASSYVEDTDGKKSYLNASYQPFKSAYRQAMHNWPDKNWKFRIPEFNESPAYYIKDPLGPYTYAESTYNPLEILKMKNYPKDRVFLIFFFRDPIEVFSSWKRNWGIVRNNELLRKNFVTSCNTLKKIRKQALMESYATDVFIYEDLRDTSADQVIQNLFSNINTHMYVSTGLKINMTEHTTKDWDSNVKMRITYPKEPSIYNRSEISSLHSDANSKQKVEYKKYKNTEINQILTKQDISEIKSSNVYEIYKYFNNQ